jgi:AcrR family transcriptional regulator
MSRPLQARAEATRLRLLEATLSSLVELGYAGTSTQAVCRRAGCSRGTLLYHFPTRETLLVAALHKVLADRVAGFVAGALEPMAADEFVRTLWSQWEGAAFTAWLELAVASRTQPALQEPLRQTMLAFDGMVSDAFAALVPGDSLPPGMAAQMPFAVFSLFNGMAVGRIYEPEGHSEPLLGMLATAASTMVQRPIGGTSWTS